MPIRITQDCINCAACIDVCPNGGIRRGQSAYIIDQDLCTECIGFFNQEQCVAICPIDCCIRNPRIVLTEEALFERAKAIHADTGKHPTLTAETSHFRVGPGSKRQGAAGPNSDIPSGSESRTASGRWWERLFRKKLTVSSSPVSSENV